MVNALNDYKTLITDKKVKIGILGLGYVGLPLALGFIGKGYQVVGFDVDQSKIDMLAKSQSYIEHIDVSVLAEAMKADQFVASSDEAVLADMDALLICVPTPLSIYREPDLTYVEKTVEMIGRHLRPSQIVILESTTYPGTCKEVIIPTLEKVTGLKAEQDFFVAYSPEREDPGNKHFDTATIPKVVGGASEESLSRAVALYELLIEKIVPVSSLETAEAVKLTENIFRSVNIAMVNELKIIYDAMDIDVWEVIRAAATKPFGFMPFYPGPGIGGHCIPIDPFYLTWKAREFGHHTRFIELAGEINAAMPDYVINKLMLALSQHKGLALSKAKVLLVGIAYKRDVDDMRESPSLIVWEKLEELGVEVTFYDPHIPEVPMTREHAEFAGRKSETDLAKAAASADASLILTEHAMIDWKQLDTADTLLVDTRNIMPRYSVDKATLIQA